MLIATVRKLFALTVAVALACHAHAESHGRDHVDTPTQTPTNGALIESAETVLELARSERRVIQMGLAAAGFDPGPADGLFGRRTRAAIREWQASRGEEVTGYLDPDTAKALLAAGGGETANTAGRPSPSTNVGGADLSSDIQRDKYILGLSNALKAEDYRNALAFIDDLRGLGGELPPTVNYFAGEAYFHLKRYAEAKTALNRYVEKTGRGGRYYQQALELMLAAEAAEDRAKARVIEERRAQEIRFHQEIRHLIALLQEDYSDTIRVTKNHANGVSEKWTHLFELPAPSIRWHSPVMVTIDLPNLCLHLLKYSASNSSHPGSDCIWWNHDRSYTIDFTRESSYDIQIIRPRCGGPACPRAGVVKRKFAYRLLLESLPGQKTVAAGGEQRIADVHGQWQHVAGLAKSLGYLVD